MQVFYLPSSENSGLWMGRISQYLETLLKQNALSSNRVQFHVRWLPDKSQGLVDSNFPLSLLLKLGVFVVIVREAPSKKSINGVRSFRLAPNDSKRNLLYELIGLFFSESGSCFSNRIK